MAFVFIVDSFCFYNDVAIMCVKLSNQGKDLTVFKVFSTSTPKKQIVLLYNAHSNEYQAILPVGDTSKYSNVFSEVLNVCMHAL